MKTLKTCNLFVTGLLGCVVTQNPIGLPAQQTGVPYPDAYTSKAVDLGPLVVHAGSTPISVTIVLQLRSLNEAENLLTSIHTQGNSLFHHFLTPGEFVARFGPAPADAAKVISQLAAYNLAAKQTGATNAKGHRVAGKHGTRFCRQSACLPGACSRKGSGLRVSRPDRRCLNSL